MSRVLLIEDTAEMREEMIAAATGDGRDLLEAKTRREALLLVEEAEDVDLVVTDLVLESGDYSDGFSILAAAREKWPDVQVIFVTSFSTRELSIEANRLGVFDLLERISNSIDFFDTLKCKVSLALRFRQALCLHGEPQ